SLWAISWIGHHDLTLNTVMTNLDRITGAAAQSAAITWTYDGDGNRLTMSGAPGPAYAAPSLAITYNNRGRLSSVTAGGVSTAYVYNALGERIAKLDPSGSTLFMYDEVGHLLGEFDGNGNLLEETLWMGDIPVATLRPNGSGGVSVYYIHADHLNSPRAITRPSDNEIVWRWDRDPFGATQPQPNPGGLGTFVYNLRLPGQYFDPETGLSYNYMRDFDAGTGRYVESDPVGLGAGVNTYVYAKGNPNSLVDPLGLWSFTFGRDDGHFFGTGRVGLGLGGGLSWDPHGEVRGGADATGCGNGAVLSVSAQGGVSLGPVGGELEIGAERNYGTDESHVYGGPSFNFESEEWGLHF